MLRTRFVPPLMANLAVWLDASDVSRMFQVSTGTTAVTASGNPVGYVGCYVGGNAIQATNNNRPTWQAAAQNGLSVLRFDGTNDSLQIASVAINAFMSIFVAGKFTTAKPFFFEHSANANLNNGFYFYGANVFTFMVRRSGVNTGRNATSATWSGSAFGVFDAQHGGSNDFAVTNNGTAVSVTDPLVQSIKTDSAETTSLNICSRNQSGVFSDGDLGELLIYNRRLTATESQFVRRHLGQKWGVNVA